MPRIMTVLNAILLGLTVLLWLALVGTVLTLNASDPAGNGLSYAFGVFITIGLWVLLAGLLIVSGVRGEMPGWAKVAALVLLPASGAAVLGSIHMMSGYASPRWPAIVPILAPALIIGFVVWATFPAIRAVISPQAAGVIAWGGILALSIVPWPFVAARTRQAASRRSEIEAQAATDALKAREVKPAGESCHFPEPDPQVSALGLDALYLRQ